jgi:signal transduction histidine kinase
MKERQIALKRQLFEQNNQMIEFCDIVSHNLRAPLINISMLTKFILESTDLAEIQLLTSKLNPSVESLNAVFNELITAIQIKRDLAIKSEHLSLIDCFNKTIASFVSEIDNKKAVLTADFSDAPDVYFPAMYLQNIFYNIISNALKYCSPERIPIINLQTKKGKDSILLSISDNGLGMDLIKNKDRLFKLGNVFHNHPDAKGFGLYIIKTQVEAMKGRMWAESVPDGGSVFFLEFKN